MYAAFLTCADTRYEGFFIAASVDAKGAPFVLTARGALGHVRKAKTIYGPKMGGLFTDLKHALAYARKVVRTKTDVDYGQFDLMWDSTGPHAANWPELIKGYQLPDGKHTRKYEGEVPREWLDIVEAMMRGDAERLVYKKAPKSSSGGKLKINIGKLKGLSKAESAASTVAASAIAALSKSLASTTAPSPPPKKLGRKALKALFAHDEEEDEEKIPPYKHEKEVIYENRRRPRFEYRPRKK